MDTVQYSETSAALYRLIRRNVTFSTSVKTWNFSLLVGCCWLLALYFTVIKLQWNWDLFVELGYSQIEVHCLPTINTIRYTLLSYIFRHVLQLPELLRSALIWDLTWPFKITLTGCPETPVNNYQFTQRSIPEELVSHFHCCRCLKSCNRNCCQFAMTSTWISWSTDIADNTFRRWILSNISPSHFSST
jgi:hypothetical protein